MRAAILARVSDKTQAGDDRHSLPFQLATMLAWAEREGWEVVHTYRIPGESAYRFYLDERPQFALAIRDALAGKFDVLIVYDVTRFARTQAVLHGALRDLRLAGVRVMVATGEWDATADPMRAGLEGIIAEAHSRQQSEKIRRALRRRFEHGLPVGDIPFGYRSVATDKPPVVVEEEAEAIRWGFEAYRRGVGYQAIAAEWNRRELRPRSKRGIGAFGVSSVQSVIENRFYAGFVSHRGEERPGAHEPIVTEAEWQRAQDTVRRQSHSAREWGALLQGLAECSVCSGPMWVKPTGERTKKRGGERRLYYWEPARVRGRECAATGRARLVEKVDAAVERAVLNMAEDGAWWEQALELARDDGEARAIERQRTELAAERRRVGLAMTRGWLDAADCAREVARIDRELASLPVDARRVFTAGEEFRSLVGLWGIASPRRRNELCRILFEGVRLDPLGDGIEVRAAPEFEELLKVRREWVAAHPKCEHTPARTRTRDRTMGLYDLRELVVA